MTDGSIGFTLNTKVVIWAQGQVGKRVGRGECWDLAERALQQAGAKTSHDLGPVGPRSDYVWGTRVDIRSARPGDVLQFRNHKVEIITKRECRFPDGASEEETDTITESRGHHTAIIYVKAGHNGLVKTLDQNVKPSGGVVQKKEL